MTPQIFPLSSVILHVALANDGDKVGCLKDKAGSDHLIQSTSPISLSLSMMATRVNQFLNSVAINF